MGRLLAAVAAGIACLIAGALGPPPTTEAACGAGLAAGNHGLRISSGGLPRVATLHVPPQAARGVPLPLVVALGGAGSTGRDFARYSNFSGLADRFGFQVLYPTAWGPRPFWNMNGHVAGKPDDVAFIDDALDAAEAAACVDRGRVYATGVSNGGGMAARLACDLADRFTAVAPVAGGYGTLPPCQPALPVAILEIHGTGDRVVPYGGKGPTHSGAVQPWLAMWRHLDGCQGPADRDDRVPGVARMTWSRCRAGTAVAHIRLAGTGHGWPGRQLAGSYVSATAETWGFFARIRRPG
jgi:polyhydroxybutyrate depolymerase